jgi:hypothetical protein
MTKDELLHFLQENLDKEEKGIPLYSMHLSNALFLSGLTPEDQERIRTLLLTLKRDSQRHKRVYEALIEKVREGAADVY